MGIGAYPKPPEGYHWQGSQLVPDGYHMEADGNLVPDEYVMTEKGTFDPKLPPAPTNDDDVNKVIADASAKAAEDKRIADENAAKGLYPLPPGFPEYIKEGGKKKKWNPNTGEYIALEDIPEPSKYTDAEGNVWETTTENGATVTRKIKAAPAPPTNQQVFDEKKAQDERDFKYKQEQDRIENERKNKQISDAEAARQQEAAQREKDRQDQLARDAETKRQFDIKQQAQQEADRQAQQQQQQQFGQTFGLQQQQFAWEQGQAAQKTAADKASRLAVLRAAPQSWLQWNLEADQTPVIQPWQKPLMPQQYGNLNVGQPIPGWTGLNQGQSSLPELTSPSMQYFARMGPTAQQQWGGYQQMQSGAPPEESYWRLQQSSAPSGRNQALSWLR